MDEHVHGGVTAGLRARGVDVLTVQEDGMDGHDDPELLDRAADLGRVMFTQDDDFLAEAARRQHLGLSFPGVIYVHQRNISVGKAVDDLEMIAVVNEPEDMADRVEYLPL